MSLRNGGALTTQYRLSGPRVRQGHILERPNAPDGVPPNQHCEDQCVDRMRSGRVSCPGRKAAPEMYDHHSIRNLGDIDQLVIERRVAIDGFMDRNVERHNLIDASDIVPEAIYERRVFIKQTAKRRHVMSIPCGLECSGRILGPVHWGLRVVCHRSLA